MPCIARFRTRWAMYMIIGLFAVGYIVLLITPIGARRTTSSLSASSSAVAFSAALSYSSSGAEEVKAVVPDVLALLLTLLGLAATDRLAHSPLVSRRTMFILLVLLALVIWSGSAYFHWSAVSETTAFRVRRNEIASSVQQRLNLGRELLDQLEVDPDYQRR